MLRQGLIQEVGMLVATATGVTAVANYDTTEQWLGVPLPVLLAAFAGASLSLTYLNEMSIRKSISTVLASTGLSVFVTSLIVWQHAVPSGPAIGLAGLLALVGQTIMGALLGELPTTISELLKVIVERARGKNGGGR